VSRHENAKEKSHRLLTTGRVRIHEAGRWYVSATVQGDSGNYVVTYERGKWVCPCAYIGACSHILALRQVTDPSHGLVMAAVAP
jgi:hypothetical protein